MRVAGLAALLLGGTAWGAEWVEMAAGSSAGNLPSAPVWFRSWLKVPDSITGDSGPDLWRDSMTLTLGSLPGPVEVFLNGRRILATENIPSGELRRFKVPKGVLEKGGFNAWVIRIDGRLATNGLVSPPVFAGYFDEVRMERPWEVTRQEPSPAELLATQTRPVRAAYGEEDFRPSTTVMSANPQPERGRFVAPDAALALLKPGEDLVVEELLHEPEVAQPTQLSFDGRGRMWVAQYRQYPFPNGVRMISRDKYYRSKYDGVPPPPPGNAPGADIISVHEDRDGDGTYEIHRRVLTGLNLANAVLHGHGGLWVMNPPYLMFYPDADGDDVPDGPPEVRLQGFGLEDTHSVANGLAWGPDGWIYGAQGSTTSSRVTRPDRDPTNAPGVYVEGCMVWRYHPEQRRYEIFADGSGNTFGVSFDGEGRLFTGHNGGDTRGWHHVQEGQYLKQGKDPGKFGPPPNPYSYGEMPAMRSTHPVPRFTHMTILADGSALPARWRGRFFGADPLHHQVIASVRKPDGATFVTTDDGLPLQTEDLTFRPVYLANSPEGGVVVADFREEYIAHGQNYQSQIDPATGRIYRLRGRDLPRERDVDLTRKTSLQLVGLLEHSNLWHRQTAVRLLAERRDRDSLSGLQLAFERAEIHPALEALWTLYQLGQLDPARIAQGLKHPQPMVRAWTIRLLGDDRTWPKELEPPLLALAETEPNAEVRSQLLSTARRLPGAQGLPLLQVVARRTNDVADPFIPLQAWFVLESQCAGNRDAVLALFSDPVFWTAPMVRQHLVPRLMRRFADSGTRQELMACARLLSMAPTDADRKALLSGFEEAFRGRTVPTLPGELVAALAASGQTNRLLRARQGDPAALQELVDLVSAPGLAPERRVETVRSLGEVRYAPAVPGLLRLALTNASSMERLAALTALQEFDDAGIATTLVAGWGQFPSGLQPAVLNLLATRAPWSRELVSAWRDGVIPASTSTPELRARIERFPDPSLHAALDALPRASSALTAETKGVPARIAAIRSILAAGPGDPYRGEPLFLERCASCHTLFFKGGRIGPDLTPYQRDDLGTLLPSILNPSAEIREGFENVVIETRDGRVLNGFLADQDAQVVMLRGLDGADVAVRRSEIVSLESAGRSLMPDGLLEGWTDPQIRDFFAYLRQSQPITR
ncbi:MAG: PVC-type heme-binding CxxCH protein [Verrucomicrobiota bacterium]